MWFYCIKCTVTLAKRTVHSAYSVYAGAEMSLFMSERITLTERRRIVYVSVLYLTLK